MKGVTLSLNRRLIALAKYTLPLKLSKQLASKTISLSADSDGSKVFQGQIELEVEKELHEQDKKTMNFLFKDKIPETYLNYQHILLTQTCHTKFITFEYYLKVSFNYSGFSLGSSIPNLSMPVQLYMF